MMQRNIAGELTVAYSENLGQLEISERTNQ